jgi:hypothetical protein
MFSSRILDKTSNCNIIKHSLLDDLLPYKKKQYKNDVYFYVYTASSKDWANIQIKLIEKENNNYINYIL